MVAHSLLNAVAGAQACVETLCDDELVLASFDRAKLDLLRVIGTQDLTVTPADH